MADTSHSASGFTLIEALVSFVITAIALGILFSLFSDFAVREEQANRTRTATLLAQSRLAEAIRMAEPIQIGRQEGRYDSGYRWVVQVEAAPEYLKDTQSEIAAYWVDVTVGWGADTKSTVQLKTLTLALKAAP